MKGAKLTRRGKIFFSLVGVVAFVAFCYLVTHIYWVGEGWCLGTVTECYK